MAKLAKSTIPSGHTKEDFTCCGPAATKDGQFDGTYLADLGCFAQGDKNDEEAVDSNKYYHACVCQSKKDSKWYTYFEWGRVGVSSPQFQFEAYATKEAAQAAYRKQLRSKNDGRGEWFDHKVLGKILRPKKDKDCYLVRPQATRSTGLPDARTITTVQPKTVVSSKTTKNSCLDSTSSKLLADLNVGTISYTRSSMTGNALPTQEAITEGRLILSHAQEIVNKSNNKKELEELTNILFSRIPKKKGRTEDAILNAERILLWNNDIDAYEAALAAYNQGTTTVQVDLPFNLRFIKQDEKVYRWITEFWLKATRNKHSYLNKELKVVNVFEIERNRDGFWGYLNTVLKNSGERKTSEIPLHQPSKREDLSEGDDERLYKQTKTWMLFHGTRSCNVSGIMKEHFRMPKTLSGVAINGAMYGSGIYFADDIKKSIGYTSYSGSIWSGGSGSISGRGAFMFICDVMIGVPYLARGSQAFQGPPSGHDSIYAKMGVASIQNNEYIVFDPRMSNLRYLVEFQ